MTNSKDLDDLIALAAAIASNSNRCGKIMISTEERPNPDSAWICLRGATHSGDCIPIDVRKVIPFS